jgi:hypothetical protein
MKHTYFLLAGLSGWLLANSVAAQTPVVTSVSPPRNAIAVPRSTPVSATFTQPLTNNTATLGALKVFSQQAGGLKPGTPTVTGNSLSLRPNTSFKGSTGPLAQPYVWQFTTASAPSTGVFGGGSDLPATSYPGTWVALGDVDGDGDLDLATVNYVYDGLVNVRRNDGTGRFGSPEVVGANRGPTSVAMADVDGDGDLDLLIVTIYSVGGVSVRLNDGSGHFSGDGLYEVPVGSYPQNVVAADVDADGDLDLLTANRNSSTVSVRRNNGQGRFSGNQEVTVGGIPSRVAVADVDGDGDLDFLTSNNSYTTSFSVRVNDGQGSFNGGYDLAVDAPPYALVLADVDGDGDVDLLASALNSNTVSVRLNAGSGHFSSSSDVTVTGVPSSLAVADVDGDGDLDLLASNSTNPNNPASYTVSVRLNDGMGRFSGTQEVAVASGPVNLTVGDVDGDGTLDVATANANGSVSVRLNAPRVLATRAGQTQRSISLYPNPASGQVHLLGLAAGSQVQLVDALGRLAHTTLVTTDDTVSLQGVAPGLYTLQAIDKQSHRYSSRLVVE